MKGRAVKIGKTGSQMEFLAPPIPHVWEPTLEDLGLRGKEGLPDPNHAALSRPWSLAAAKICL